MRSLFRYAKRNRLIFRDPTVGRPARPLMVPIDNNAYKTAVAAAITPDQRVMLALTVVHAARRPAIRNLVLDDIDLPNRHITIGGHTRPLDELTTRTIVEHLAHRRRRPPPPRRRVRHLRDGRHALRRIRPSPPRQHRRDKPLPTRQTTHRTGPMRSQAGPRRLASWPRAQASLRDGGGHIGPGGDPPQRMQPQRRATTGR